MRDWGKNRRQMVHKLNGKLLEALTAQLTKQIGWSPNHWIINVIILRRIIEETEQAFLKTSATMLNGKIYDEEDELNPAKGMGDFDRVVPLIKSLSGYCIRTGNVVWVDNLEDLTKDKEHPLYHDYRPFQYVSVKPENEPVAEYVFPIRVQIGLSEAILGVVNAERTKKGGNEFKATGFHKVLDTVISLLDVHGPFLVVAEHVKIIEADDKENAVPGTLDERFKTINDQVRDSLLDAHLRALEAIMLPVEKEVLPNENI